MACPYHCPSPIFLHIAARKRVFLKCKPNQHPCLKAFNAPRSLYKKVQTTEWHTKLANILGLPMFSTYLSHILHANSTIFSHYTLSPVSLCMLPRMLFTQPFSPKRLKSSRKYPAYFPSDALSAFLPWSHWVPYYDSISMYSHYNTL